jgi:hypothetical protein
MATPLDSFVFSHEELEMALKFMAAACDIYAHEDHRRRAYSMLEVVHKDILQHVTVKLDAHRSCVPSGHTTVHCPNLSVGTFVLSSASEVKNEVGEGGSDPIAQAECDYVAVVASDMVMHPFFEYAIITN